MSVDVDATTTLAMTTHTDPVEAPEPPDPYIVRAKSIIGYKTWVATTRAAAVQDAFTALVLPCDAGFTADRCSRSAARLLNALSRALCDPDGMDYDLAVVSLPAAAVRLTGDYLGVDEVPDWISFEGTLREVNEAIAVGHQDDGQQQAVASTSRVLTKSWSEVAGVGECARPRGERSHLSWWLNTLKRYRPDLSTTHGLRLQGGLAWLSAFSPHGSASSQPAFGRTLEPWLAHAVLLREALEMRDSRFRYLGETEASARWGVRTDPRREIVVEPFYSTHRAGKMTWAAFETRSAVDVDGKRTYGDEAVGFFKISWPKKAAPPRRKRSKAAASTVTSDSDTAPARPVLPGLEKPGVLPPQREVEFFDLAHKGSWLPGLARHWTSAKAAQSLCGPSLTPPSLILPHPTKAGQSRTREKLSLHLASVGQPLSQCTSALHLLKVIYDALQTHLELCKRGLLHQDVSWHNLLCNPVHDPAVLLNTGKEVASVDDVPTIDYILTGDRTKESCALLTDLDLSTTFTTGKDGEPILGDQRIVGTPMFVAVERSSGKCEERLPNNHLGLRQDVLPKLREIESHPELFKRAFPRGANGYAQTIDQVFKKEERIAAGKTNPKTPHLPRHDVESLFWILFWCLARACPVGSDPLDELKGDLSTFVAAMMLHNLDEENLRRKYFKYSHFETVLHPRLAQRFAPLLHTMLRYLSVPWHRYDKVVGYYHAHVAMMRLILPEIHALSLDPTLDVLFDTTQPRIRNLEIDNPWPEEFSFKRITFGELTNVVAGNAGSAAITLVDSDGAAAMDVDTENILARRKRVRDDEEDDMTRSKRQKFDTTTAPPAKTTILPPPSYKVSELSDLFWDTRMWLGRGDRDPGPKRPALRAQKALIVSDASECA